MLITFFVGAIVHYLPAFHNVNDAGLYDDKEFWEVSCLFSVCILNYLWSGTIMLTVQYKIVDILYHMLEVMVILKRFGVGYVKIITLTHLCYGL